MGSVESDRDRAPHSGVELEAWNAPQRLAAILESSEEAIIGMSIGGIVQSWNAAAGRVYGYTAEEMIGQPMTVLLPSDRPGEGIEILDRIQRGERVRCFETVRVRKGGARVEVSLTIAPIRNTAGQMVGAYHVSRDITERVEYETSAAQLAAIVESSDYAIIGTSLNGLIESWNCGAERIYGYTAGEVLGRSLLMLLPPDRMDEETDILARIKVGQRAQHFDTVRVRKDGRHVNVALTISPIKNRKGEIVGASHIAKDIAATIQLETATAQLAAIVESSEDAIVSKNLDGIILTWNAAAERIYGYTAQEARGQSMTILLPPERPNEEAAILVRLRNGDRVEHFETVRVRKDGKRIEVSLTISVIRDKSGKISGASHIARDITDRKQFEKQMRETQKLESLGVLAGGVAHDFNNLLTGILGSASLVFETLSPSSPNRRPVAEIIKAAERASGLTRQLLAYAGKGKFVTEVINLSELAREITGLIETSIPRKVQLRLDLKPDLPAIEADTGQLQQVIMNLVINGAEAIGEAAGAVTLATGVQIVDEPYINSVLGKDDLIPGQYVTLEVHDTGCGMDEATLARIFDPFFTTKFTGRGLGLAAVRGIVRSHKGALKVYSRPGQGTTFKLLFPVAQAGVPVSSTGARHDLRGSGTILVVDDEEIVRQTARNTLEHYGYSVILAKNGEEAIKIFREDPGRIALVLLDLTMPIMGGEETLRHLTSFRPSVRVLLSSGFNEVEAIRRFTGKGLAGFVQKPYAAVQLATRVKSVLSADESHR